MEKLQRPWQWLQLHRHGFVHPILIVTIVGPAVTPAFAAALTSAGCETNLK
jgi:hypothetical protein